MKVIYKGMHYCLNFLNFKPYFGLNGVKKLEYKVMFTSSCRYSLGIDQSDINKLFGISYGFHHNQSDRIGWRYIAEIDKIELLLYSYVKGLRRTKSLGLYDINKEISIKLESIVYKGNYRTINVIINNEVIGRDIFPHNYKNFGYTLGAYFGGNRKAPHTMKIKIEKS